MKALCVYCGSSAGVSPRYAQEARALGALLVERGITLVYGGGKVGLMGTIADEVMRLGGQATGVIPQALMDKEVGHKGLTALHVVKNMHERKAMMAELSDGFIAMPGGIGTLEELFEVFTWAQLRFHDKPIGILNTEGYYDALLGFVTHMVEQGFVKADQAKLLMSAPDPQALLARFDNFEVVPHDKFLNLVRSEA